MTEYSREEAVKKIKDYERSMKLLSVYYVKKEVLELEIQNELGILAEMENQKLEMMKEYIKKHDDEEEEDYRK
jgi:hypothetical protein